MLRRLRQIGQGYWQSDGSAKQLSTSDLATAGHRPELWRAKWSKGGRIIFEVSASR